MNQFCPATMIPRTTLGTLNPRISAQTETHCLREIGERPPYTMYYMRRFFFLALVYVHLVENIKSLYFLNQIFQQEKKNNNTFYCNILFGCFLRKCL